MALTRGRLSNVTAIAGAANANVVTVANNKKVYVYSIAPFVVERCFEQIKIDLCVMKLPVTIVGVGTCYSYSTDGPTHHAIDDISVMNTIPNMNIISPCDPIHFKSILRNIIHINYKQTNFILNASQLIPEIFRRIIYKNFLKGNLRLKE